MNVGFIGLGNIGMPMARCLLNAGFNLKVHNRSRGKVHDMVSLGASPASSPGQLTRESDIVLTCLPDVPAVEQMYLGEDGVVPSARCGQVLIDHSTVGPSTSRMIAEAAGIMGARFLDAPVSGGPESAAAGRLTIMVGGDREAYEEALPVLNAMGQNILHMGPSGVGSTVKLANNLLLAINLAGAAEAFHLGVKMGGDPKSLLETFNKSSGQSWALDYVGPSMQRREFLGSGSQVRILLKDLALIQQTAGEMSVPLPLGNAALGVHQASYVHWPENTSWSSLLLVLERLSEELRRE